MLASMKRRGWWIFRTVLALAVGIALVIAAVIALTRADGIGVLFLIFGVPLLGAGLMRLWVLRRVSAQPTGNQPT